MSNLGSGNGGELTFIDILSIISLCIGLQNLDLNLAQEDLDKQTQDLDSSLRAVVDDIHRHLQDQDQKIDEILRRMDNADY